MREPARALNFFGSKVQAARLYPAPKHPVIIEPFCGGAGYSLRYRRHEVRLSDTNPEVVEAWRYLIETPARTIARLPLLEPGQSIPPDLPFGARLLIGWNCCLVGARPQNRLVPSAARVPSSFWGESKRASLARLAEQIRHWKVELAGYQDNENRVATWFVDAPYQGVDGSHYRQGSSRIDYDHLARWCREREGQTIVCEKPPAGWLPFRPHHQHVSAPTADVKGRRRTDELIWTNDV